LTKLTKTFLEEAKRRRTTKNTQIDNTIKNKEKLLTEYSEIATEIKDQIGPVLTVPFLSGIFDFVCSKGDENRACDLIQTKSLLVLKNRNKQLSQNNKTNNNFNQGLVFGNLTNYDYGLNLSNSRFRKSIEKKYPGTKFVQFEMVLTRGTWQIVPSREGDLIKKQWHEILAKGIAPRSYEGIVKRISHLISSKNVSHVVFDISLINHQICAIYNPLTQIVEIYDPNGDVDGDYPGLVGALKKLFSEATKKLPKGLYKGAKPIFMDDIHSTILKHGERCEEDGICTVVSAIIIKHRLKFPLVSPEKAMDILIKNTFKKTGKRAKTLDFARSFAASYGGVKRGGFKTTRLKLPGKRSSKSWSDEFITGIPENLPNTVKRSYRLRNMTIPEWMRSKNTAVDPYPSTIYPRWKGQKTFL